MQHEDCTDLVFSFLNLAEHSFYPVSAKVVLYVSTQQLDVLQFTHTVYIYFNVLNEPIYIEPHMPACT